MAKLKAESEQRDATENITFLQTTGGNKWLCNTP